MPPPPLIGRNAGANHMKRIFAALGALLLCGQAPAEWTFFGMTTMEDVKCHNFFLTSTIVRTGDLVRVRAKSLPVESINETKLPKDVYDRNASRAKEGYHPPFSKIQALTPYEELVTMAWQEKAKGDDIEPIASMLWEIDCAKNLIRSVETVTRRQRDPVPTPWQPNLLDSVSGNLQKLVCGQA